MFMFIGGWRRIEKYAAIDGFTIKIHLLQKHIINYGAFFINNLFNKWDL